MKISILSAAAAALLCACAAQAPTHWTKSGATQRDFELDVESCRARAAALPEPPRANALQQRERDLPGVALAGGGALHPDFIEDCLRTRGWRRE